MSKSNTWIKGALYFPLLSLMAIAMFGCGGGENAVVDKEDIVYSLAGDDSSGLFRGHNMGDLPEAVRKNEAWQPVIDSDTLMRYGHTLKRDSAKVEVIAYYTFDTFGLFEMQFDLLPADEEVVKELREEFEDYFTQRFGKPDRLGISQRWTTVSPSNARVEILLTNESADYGKPFLSLNFYESIGDEI